MASSCVSNTFQKSWLDMDIYPLNLAHKPANAYPAALRALQKRFDDASTDMFVADEVDVEVPWRDLKPTSGEDAKSWNIHSEAKLMQILGLDVTNGPNGERLVGVRHKDSKCRFIYIYGHTSRSALNITKSMLVKILTFHQVMPVYLDFMLVFGLQEEPDDLRFASFREQKSFAANSLAPEIPSLGRSGHQYQLCYNLKSISQLDGGDFSAIRQAAIYHQFDVKSGNAVWIVTKGRLDLQQRFKELTGKDGRQEDKSFETPIECFRSSLAAHLMFCFWSTENWRFYIKQLEQDLEHGTGLALLGPRGPGSKHKWYEPTDVQALQILEDKTNEIIMVLQANIDIISALSRFYQRLVTNAQFPLSHSCEEDLSGFVAQLDDMISDLKIQINRASTLVKITNDRKELIIQHIQSQSTERMEELNANMEKEAIMVRIITIVTLVYLPATFVSYQGQGSEAGNFSNMAMSRWLEVALPLTFLTLLIAWAGRSWAEHQRGIRKRGRSLANALWPFPRRTEESCLPLYIEKAPNRTMLCGRTLLWGKRMT
ncbi:uncharacterized protein BCR38DRAFT_448876 [Pseudomassariella vexata]|uniref:CorA-like transporter domain-containing protein n=1 Tax=Pseudomassariella vexata TaxID=1141098 RepID=A0A1Y2DFE5_9PEZI|nr:uncharacterized protein BCR38DRAFT_448876 [Pseudomassariella vexata]ORY57866.1 hypothetical protein BCR38DRAFT_448876 [Pseudomassariella vexata]